VASPPLRVCAQQGCGTRVSSGYCATCRPTRREHTHATDPRYGTMRWRRYSAQRRAEHPFCALCGALAAGQEHGVSRGVTDHIIPVTEAPDLFDDPTNHRTLCRRCNRQAQVDRDRQRAMGDTGHATATGGEGPTGRRYLTTSARGLFPGFA
jgi:5-methylcytosine-specific restriction endonuclease McrA